MLPAKRFDLVMADLDDLAATGAASFHNTDSIGFRNRLGAHQCEPLAYAHEYVSVIDRRPPRSSAAKITGVYSISRHHSSTTTGCGPRGYGGICHAMIVIKDETAGSLEALASKLSGGEIRMRWIVKTGLRVRPHPPPRVDARVDGSRRASDRAPRCHPRGS